MNLLAFLSDRCNMTCSYCFLDLNHGAAVALSAEDLAAAIGAYRAARPGGRVTFLGGEPSLHWDVLRSGAALAGAPCTVVTNGTRLSPAQLAELASLGAQICVSLDGGARDNDASRRLLSGGSAHAAVLERLSGADKAALRANLVVSPATAGRLVQNLESLRAAGFRRFSFHPDVLGGWDQAALGALKVSLGALKKYLAAAGPAVEVAHAASYASSCEGYEDVVFGADARYYPCDGLFARPYAELGAYACGDARSGLDQAARRRWHERAMSDIHSWIGPHHTCPREAYFHALALGRDARAACERYQAADAALGEALCAAA